VSRLVFEDRVKEHGSGSTLSKPGLSSRRVKLYALKDVASR
jgi:hypothetical protein